MQRLLEQALNAELATNAFAIVWAYWRSGGWLMLPLALVSFGILLSYFLLLSRLRVSLATPEDLISVVEERLCRDGQHQALTDWLASLPGAVPRLTRHVLVRIAAGLPFADAFQQCRDGELAFYSHAFYVMGALVVVAPLLGLLGTVFGMIETFDAVAMRSGQTADMVAGGISRALITTQVGLVAALPGTFGLAHLHRLYCRLRNEIDRFQSHLFMAVERLGAS